MIDPRKESARVEKAYQQWQSFRTAYDYAAGILSGEIVANAERIEAAERFFRDLLNPAYDIRMKPPEFVIRIIERTIKHNQGEKLDGTPLKGTPLILEPWQVFVVVNLLLQGGNERAAIQGGVRLCSAQKRKDAAHCWACVGRRSDGARVRIVDLHRRRVQASGGAIVQRYHFLA